MKEMVKYGFILSVICLIAAGLLSAVNSLTKGRIIAQAIAEEEASLKEVISKDACFEAVKEGTEIIYYKARDKEGKLVGVAFKASARGYSSAVETMVGMLTDGTINAIKILNQNETPGLGARISEPAFTGQFNRIQSEDLGGIQAITGATISSRAVIDSVKEKAIKIKELIKNAK